MDKHKVEGFKVSGGLDISKVVRIKESLEKLIIDFKTGPGTWETDYLRDQELNEVISLYPVNPQIINFIEVPLGSTNIKSSKEKVEFRLNEYTYRIYFEPRKK